MSETTTFREPSRTITFDGEQEKKYPNELITRYQEVVGNARLNWTEYHDFGRLLGSGGQGLVYYSQRRGADQFTLPVALKIFSPERFVNAKAYDLAMGRIAKVAALIAQIQQDNLLDVQNFIDRNRIRIMEMEWIEGYDLRQLLTNEMMKKLHYRVMDSRWEDLNNIVITKGVVQPRLKPGIAIAVVRDCLAALAALHREDIVHGDIKPSNIMLKLTGDAKIVDMGSAFEIKDPPPHRTCTPSYAAPEVLEGNECTPQSDLASLGYVLIELLSGRPPFAGISILRDLLEAKRFLAQRLDKIMPQEIVVNELLMNFCRSLVAPDPMKRFQSAEAADMLKEGAAEFHRQLIKSNMASEYKNEIRLLLLDVDEAVKTERGED